MITGGLRPVVLELLVLVSNEVGTIGGGGDVVAVAVPVKELVVALMPKVETTSAEDRSPITGVVRVVFVPLLELVTRVEKLADGSTIGNVAESVVRGPLVAMLTNGVMVSMGVINEPPDENGGSVETTGSVAEFVIKEPVDMVGVTTGRL